MADPIIEPIATTQVAPPTNQTSPVETTTSPTPTTTQTATVEPTGNIISRVTKKKEIKPEDTAGTFKIFDDITDPVQREKLIGREKERIADYTRKTQELSRQREEFDRFKQESQNWSPERIQKELLNNPQFMQAAQQVASVQNPAGSGLTDEQFSALTPAEKNQLGKMNQEIGELRQQNFMSAMGQKDALLQTKYGDYDALKVSKGLQDLSRMNPLDIREYAYKALSHDEHVQSAYEEGLKDGKGLNQQRVQASTTTGFNSLPADKKPIRDKRDTDTSYFVKLAQARIDESKGLQASKR